MCAIIGALVWGLTTPERMGMANELLNYIVAASHERGRDGRGFLIIAGTDQDTVEHRYLESRSVDRVADGPWCYREFFDRPVDVATVLGNLRAEPTTEYVADKRLQDQQPYTAGEWSIVHNGTIANDKALRTNVVDTAIDSAAIAEALDSEMASGLPSYTAEHFVKHVQRLKGSFAILANYAPQPEHMLVAANYRPVWYVVTEIGVFFASARHYFPDNMTPRMVEPYSVMSFFHFDGELHIQGASLLADPATAQRRALVVCSGGLDSVVAATWAVRVGGFEVVTLLHFRYGSRAEGPEETAIWKVVEALDIGVRFANIDVYSPDDSPLLQADSKLAGGEEGAEFAHEWVPARNLVMLSLATAMAEAAGFDTIILGNNLEEAGAYPDNEPEFIARFNDLLPFAVGDGKRVRVIMPVGNLMKHEIVALGHQLGAPLDKTWSCYRAGEQHCGTCGPCYMRRKAFEINGLPEVITYMNGK